MGSSRSHSSPWRFPQKITDDCGGVSNFRVGSFGLTLLRREFVGISAGNRGIPSELEMIAVASYGTPRFPWVRGGFSGVQWELQSFPMGACWLPVFRGDSIRYGFGIYGTVLCLEFKPS